MDYRMMTLNSNIKCLSFCERAAANGRADEQLGRHLMIVPWIEKIESLIEPIRNGMERLLETHSARRETNALRNKCILKLSRGVRDFRSGLARRLLRNDEPEYLLSYYKVPGSSLSGNKTPDEWYQIATFLLKGEEKALAKGFPAMSNPSVTELTECLATFDELRIANDVTDRNYREAQAVMADLRQQAQQASRGLAANLRVLHNDVESPSLRRAMRGYGFVFRGENPTSLEGESQDPNAEQFPETGTEAIHVEPREVTAA